MSALQDSTLLQAALAGLVLFVLMGTLCFEAKTVGSEAERRLTVPLNFVNAADWPNVLSTAQASKSSASASERNSSSMFNEFRRNR